MSPTCPLTKLPCTTVKCVEEGMCQNSAIPSFMDELGTVGSMVIGRYIYQSNTTLHTPDSLREGLLKYLDQEQKLAQEQQDQARRWDRGPEPAND